MTLPIEYTNTIGADCPAALSRSEGTIFINPDVYDKLTPFQQKFVLLHEYGHYIHDTHDEFRADEYAFNQLAGTEFQSLKKCLSSLSDILANDPARDARYFNLYKMAQRWDAANGNDDMAEYLTSRVIPGAPLDKFLQIGGDTYGDTQIKVAQAESLMQQGNLAAKNINWSGFKSTLNAIMVVGLCAFIFYFLFANKN